VPLPELIEIVPLQTRVVAAISVPGSKSITNRALILAALADGETVLRGGLWSEDTQVMVDCLQDLGFMVNVAPDVHEPCNRTITVYGKGGTVPPGGSEQQPLDLFVGNAGTAARFLSAFVTLGKGSYRLHGIGRMHERPQASLFRALRSLGYRIESSNDRLPAIIHGAGPRSGKCQVSIQESSQFASALLLSATAGGWEVTVSGNDSEEAAYVTMTEKMVQVFPKNGGTFQIEPDASSGSYFLAVSLLGLSAAETMQFPRQFGTKVKTDYRTSVSVANWPHSGWQIDENFPRVMGWAAQDPELVQHLESSRTSSSTPSRDISGASPGEGISRARDLGDSIMTAIAIAPITLTSLTDRPARFTDLGRLRVQECERVSALRTELTKCGAKVIESGDTLEVSPSSLHGAEIETYNDHRMAMCFAILGLKVPGIKIKNPSCVKKTFPNFFQKLAAVAPDGLGVEIRDGHSGRRLAVEKLFAE
jgi:3-phosphoshikimate 1-carboxyvinyltransferase